MKLTLRIIHWLALVLVIIGALNWGMVGLFQFNVLGWLFGHAGARVLFTVVGIAGIWCISLFTHLASCEIDKWQKK